MKILLITPTYFPKITGNAVSTERISLGLQKLYHEVMIRTPEQINIEDIRAFDPDIIHSLHAYRTRIAKDLSIIMKIPYIITLTGSDYEECIEDSVKADSSLECSDRKKLTLDMMYNSSALAVYNNKTKESILSKFPDLKGNIHVIRKGIPIVGTNDYKIRSGNNINESDFLFTLIAGIRPRKNNIFPIIALSRLRHDKKNIKLLLVGSVSDDIYYNKIKEIIKDLDWVKYVGQIPLENMGSVYNESDVILNCSQYEGESNVVFEAMCFGKPILVSAVHGNIPLIENMKNGLTYVNEDTEDFIRQAGFLYSDDSLRKRLGDAAILDSGIMINKNEAKYYEKLYTKAINKCKN